MIQRLAMTLLGTLWLSACPFYTTFAHTDGPMSVSTIEVQTTTQSYRVIHGTVVDDTGAPLPQATVRVNGTKTGTVTDSAGKFRLRLPAKEAQELTLVVSFVGMDPAEYKVKPNTRMPIKISMRTANRMLSEVVANGMQTINRERVTGSASVLTAKDIKLQGFTSIDKMIEGMVVGLNSTSVSGAPGTRAKITIRGENSLNGNTEPLWIVDGLPLTTGVPKVVGGNYSATIMQDGVGNIMPEDIESISILKDAAASSIYGARAANGVIVITTKKGFRSKTQITYSGSTTVGSTPKVNLGMMSGNEKMLYERMILDSYGLDKVPLAGRYGNLYSRYLNGYITESEFKSEESRMKSIDTDWMKVLFRPAFSHLHNINLRGGSDELTYYTSLTYNHQDGILRTNSYENAGLMLNMDYRPSTKWILSLSFNASARKSLDHASVVDPFNYGVFANRYEQPYNPDGSYAADLSYLPNNFSHVTGSGYSVDDFNILREMDRTKSTMRGLDAYMTVTARYEPFRGLILTSIFNQSLSYNKDMREMAPGTFSSYSSAKLARLVFPNTPLLSKDYDDGELYEASGENSSWSMRNSIDYSFQPSNNQLITLLGAMEIMDRRFNNFGYTSPVYYDDFRIVGLPNFDTVDPKYKDLMVALQEAYETQEGQDRSVSFLASGMYNLFQDRYVLTGSFRADGADMIGDANRFTPLWHVGLKYNMHREALFTLPSWLTTLALRSSFGYTGNINRTALPFATIGLSNLTYMGNRVVNNLVFPNPYVKWERKRNFGAALETSIENRVFLTA